MQLRLIILLVPVHRLHCYRSRPSQIPGMCYRAGIQPVYWARLRMMGSLQCVPALFSSYLTKPVHMAGCSWQLMSA